MCQSLECIGLISTSSYLNLAIRNYMNKFTKIQVIIYNRALPIELFVNKFLNVKTVVVEEVQ